MTRQQVTVRFQNEGHVEHGTFLRWHDQDSIVVRVNRTQATIHLHRDRIEDQNGPFPPKPVVRPVLWHPEAAVKQVACHRFVHSEAKLRQDYPGMEFWYAQGSSGVWWRLQWSEDGGWFVPAIRVQDPYTRIRRMQAANCGA